ncbi:unnamed protein product [Ambrosiozyma monospora]|uniref:protein disulfide-isomerase n=1 Tax=Ambrosiozyma monospora TaxID=43982 RepID=A0A9W6YP06_AMBMO|nr:unnamed protein product [Ambrosiozyma monospora]
MKFLSFYLLFTMLLTTVFAAGGVLKNTNRIPRDQLEQIKRNANSLIKNYVITVDENNFEEVVLKSGKNSFVKFYADWCSHCKKMAPTWESLALGFKNKEEMQIVEINADKNKKIGKMFGITGYPTLKLFKADDVNHPLEYNGGRDYMSFINFIKATTGIEGRTAKPPGGKGSKKSASKVVQLHDGSIERMVEHKERSAIIAFTKEKCIHCEKLKDTWNKLADVYHRDLERVLISQVNTSGDEPTDWLKNRYEVTSFPTILFVTDGNLDEPEVYEGDRSLTDLVRFVNEKTFLHRSADGGLDSLAGTLPQMNGKIKAFVGSNRVTRIAMVKEVVNELRILDKEKKFTEEIKYYAKVINSLVSGGFEFIDGEISRLGNMMKSGALNDDSRDSIRMRLNALKLFKSFETPESHEVGNRDEL